MASSIEELEAQQARAKKRLAEIRAEVRNAGKRARRLEQSTHMAVTLYEAGVQGQFPLLGAQQQAALLMLFELSDLCADVVVSYALGQGRDAKHKCSEFDEWDPEVRQAMSAAVYMLYNQVEFSHVVNALEGTEYSQKALCRYVVEYRVFHWAVEQNCDKGVSPSPRLVYEAASRLVPAAAPQLIRQGLKSFFLSGRRAVRSWLLVFKKRWHGKHGNLGAGEHLEPGLLEQKEPCQV